MEKVRIKINNVEHIYDKGISLKDISNNLNKNKNEAVLAIVNGKLKELNYYVNKDSTIEFIGLNSTDGQKVYKRSLSFLFIKAVHDLFTGAKVELCHTLSKGQYCIIHNYTGFNEEATNKIKNKMIELINKDIPFVKEELKLEDAIKLFKKTNRYDKINLFETIDKETVNIYDLDGYKDYFYGYLVPSTGYLRVFDIVYENNGVVLLCPKKSNPKEVTEHKYQPKLLSTFQETKNWAEIMGVNYVGHLNKIILNNEYPDLIRTVEALHENKLVKIADTIKSLNKRVILIAGPSSSGKTSFSKRLAIQLKVLGLKPIAISLDDYFINRVNTPLDEDGKYDFESIHALDLELFNNQLKSLLANEEVELPLYNFKLGEREPKGIKLKINENQPIIIEGIHGLNPLLTSLIPAEYKFKIYVSPLTQLNLDYHNRISTTDCRLIRRIVRDNQFRGHDAKKTISMWDSVRRGEEKNIFPYQEDADAIFNSTLIYELSVLKKYAVPLLEKIQENEDEYIKAKELLKFLYYFKEIEEEVDIPRTSILAEFTGTSRIVN